MDLRKQPKFGMKEVFLSLSDKDNDADQDNVDDGNRLMMETAVARIYMLITQFAVLLEMILQH